MTTIDELSQSVRKDMMQVINVANLVTTLPLEQVAATHQILSQFIGNDKDVEYRNAEFLQVVYILLRAKGELLSADLIARINGKEISNE